MMLVDLTKRPTKVDRPSDVTGLVDVGDLTTRTQPDGRGCGDGIDLPHQRREAEELHAGRRSDGARGRRREGSGALRLSEERRCCRELRQPVADQPGNGPADRRTDRHLHAGGVRRQRRVPQNRLGHEDGYQRLRRCRHHRNGRLRLSRRQARGRRSERLSCGRVHGRVSAVCRRSRQAADDVRLLRRLIVEQRRDRCIGRRQRQRRMDQRQPADGSDLVPRLQPDRASRS